MSADVDELTRQLTSVGGQLGFLGCTIITAPAEHHEALMSVLQPLIDIETIGPTILLATGSSDEDTDRYLDRALEIVLYPESRNEEDC
jgi:hypothetical protein